MKLETKQMILMAAIVAIIVFSGSVEEKKESAGEISRSIIGVALIGVAFFIPFPWGAAAFIPGLLMVGTGVVGIFTPDPVIPGWAWIFGILAIFMILLRRK